ncbi:MAG: hypothetical protein WD204_02460, partial [Acidimicrobiia bacterium]
MISWDSAGEIHREAKAIRSAIDSGDLSGLATQPFHRPDRDLGIDRSALENLLTEIGEVIGLVAETRDRTAADL